jgi:hypothetical protein
MKRNQIRLDLARREFAGGRSFGDTGPYERLVGKASFAIDPNEPNLPFVCDLELAPRNSAGLVEFSATLDIVKPADLTRGKRKVLFEFSNRGGRALGGFNYGKGRDLSKADYGGDGFLMRHGYTLVWCGWQGDLFDRGDNVVANLPWALQNGKPVRGRIRQEFSTIEPGILSMGVAEGAERGEEVHRPTRSSTASAAR